MMGMTIAEKILSKKNVTGEPVEAGDFIAPGIQEIAEDGGELEIDYSAGLARNPKTGASVKLQRYPPSVERVFEAGGLANLIAQRLRRQGTSEKRRKRGIPC